jgi:GH18 family chitinase
MQTKLTPSYAHICCSLNTSLLIQKKALKSHQLKIYRMVALFNNEDNDNDTFIDISAFIKEMKLKGVSQVFLGIGDKKNMNYEQYRDMTASEERRAQFVKNVVKIVDTYGFDGFLPKWTYPGCKNVGIMD